MDILAQPCYKTTKYFVTLIGRWPYQHQTQSLIIVTVLWIALILQAILQIIAFVTYSDDRDVLFEGLSSFMVEFLLAAKYLNASYHAKLIKNLFDKVQRDWNLLTNDGERRILQCHSDTGRLLSTEYAAFLLSSTTIFVMEPLVPRIYGFLSKSNESIPLRFAFPVEYMIIEKEDHYWLTVTLTSLFTYISTLGIISCDIIFITLLQHICGLFAVLGYRIEHTPIGESTEKNEQEVYISGQTDSQDESYEHLVSCVEMHSRNLEFAELLEECFSLSFGVVILLNLPLISVTGLQIITQNNTVQQILKGVSFLCADIIHLFFDCYMSQKLNDSSARISHRIANVEWYDHSVKSKKLLVVMIMRSQVPCKLTAGKIMDLSIENYATMLKSAGSYFTMLLSFQ